MKVLQIPMSDEEWEKLEEKATSEGITTTQYVKNLMFPENDFQKWFPLLLQKVEDMEDVCSFTLRDIMVERWIEIPKGTKLAMGRVFFSLVDSGKIPHVSKNGINSSKTQCYMKDSNGEL